MPLSMVLEMPCVSWVFMTLGTNGPKLLVPKVKPLVNTSGYDQRCFDLKKVNRSYKCATFLSHFL